LIAVFVERFGIGPAGMSPSASPPLSRRHDAGERRLSV